MSVFPLGVARISSDSTEAEASAQLFVEDGTFEIFLTASVGQCIVPGAIGFPGIARVPARPGGPAEAPSP